MKERLEVFMLSIDKSALLKHVESVTAKTAKMSEPFSAGQYWCCFEFVLEDESLVIARVRLPPHPNSDKTTISTDKSATYAIECEAATMSFLQSKPISVPAPKLYALALPGSEQAEAVGACYMLIEGFYGNTLQDVQSDICALPLDTQEHIISQWTAIQAELATFSFPKIGSISHFSEKDGPTIGPLASAIAENFRHPGPFNSGYEYFTAVGEARYLSARKDASGSDESDNFALIGTSIFRDIVLRTELFKGTETSFPFTHMDMGTQNILVDDDFNFLAIIDWEFAQTAPVQVNHYPMPFPLLSSDAEIHEILQNPEHIAHRNVSRQTTAQKLYRDQFLKAEQALAQQGRKITPSIAKGLNGTASRIYGMLERLNGFAAEDLAYEMVLLAFGLEGMEAKRYVLGKIFVMVTEDRDK